MTRCNRLAVNPRLTLLAALSMLILAACGPQIEAESAALASTPSDEGSLAGKGDSQASPNIKVSGTNAADVAATVTGGGFINVVNNGAHVAATETGTGTINIVNNGGVLTATNTGNGVMTINSTATGAVTVTNTGHGRVTVNAAGAAPISLTHTGDDDFTYP